MNPSKQDPPSDAAPDPEFMKKFEDTIRSWADATSADKADEAQNAAIQALIMAGEEALKNPTPELLLKAEADNLENSGDWTKAEAVRRKILGLEESSGNFGLVAKAQLDLCWLLRTVGRIAEASEFARDAVGSARRADVFPLLVMALETEAACALERGDSAKAIACVSEAVQVIEPGKIYHQLRAKALTTRARCLLAQGDQIGAAADLASSRELFPAETNSCLLPGQIVKLANWWEVKSQLEERQGNLEDARQALARSIEYRRQLDSPHARFTLARALNKLAEISRNIGDFRSQESASKEATSIRRELQLPGHHS